MQRELVDKKRWLTQEEFLDEWAVAQIMPGPNVVNLMLMIGGRYFGLRGALAALSGMLTVPLVIVILLAALYAHHAFHPGVAGALRGMGVVAAGMIIATGFKLFPALKSNPIPLTVCMIFCVACFVTVGLLHWPLVFILPALGIPAFWLAWRRLDR